MAKPNVRNALTAYSAGMSPSTVLGRSAVLLKVSRSGRCSVTLRRTGCSGWRRNGYGTFGGRDGSKQSIDKAGLD
jgi:hypothetical protein